MPDMDCTVSCCGTTTVGSGKKGGVSLFVLAWQPSSFRPLAPSSFSLGRNGDQAIACVLSEYSTGWCDAAMRCAMRCGCTCVGCWFCRIGQDRTGSPIPNRSTHTPMDVITDIFRRGWRKYVCRTQQAMKERYNTLLHIDEQDPPTALYFESSASCSSWPALLRYPYSTYLARLTTTRATPAPPGCRLSKPVLQQQRGTRSC